MRSGAFRFDVGGPARASRAARVLDDSGQRLRIEVDLGQGRPSGVRELELTAAGTCEGRVSELARWLVLLEEGREIDRLPLLIRAGDTTLLRR